MIPLTPAAVGSYGTTHSERGDVLGLGAAVPFLLLAFGSLGFARPRLVQNVTITDVVLFALITTWAVHVVRDRSASEVEGARLVVPLSLLFGGSLIASAYVGLRFFIVDDLVRDLGAFLSFLAVLDLLRRSGERVRLWTVRATIVSVVTATVTLVLDPALRGRGTFPNPNLPAHLLACALLFFAFARLDRRLRLVVVVVAAVGLYRTGSFGSALQLGAGFGYMLITWVLARTHGRERARLVFFAGLSLAVVATILSIASYLGRPEAKEESGLSSARLDRSSDTRFETWEDTFANFTEQPFGTGPGSSRGLELLEKHTGLPTEAHNEPLSYLAERGFIGFAGLVLLWTTLWRLTRPRGIARALLCGYLLASVFRETLHYRHWWLFLPLAMVMDEQHLGWGRGRSPADAEPAEVDPSDAELVAVR